MSRLAGVAGLADLATCCATARSMPCFVGRPAALRLCTTQAGDLGAGAGRAAARHPARRAAGAGAAGPALSRGRHPAAAWGAPGVLPALESLTLRALWSGGLPPAWARGFRQLRTLRLADFYWRASRPSAAADPSTLSGGGGGGGAEAEGRGDPWATDPWAAASELEPGEQGMTEVFPHWPASSSSSSTGDSSSSGSSSDSGGSGGGSSGSSQAGAGGSGGGGLAPTLPRDWAGGFPALRSLALNGLALEGPLPAAWMTDAALPLLYLL